MARDLAGVLAQAAELRERADKARTWSKRLAWFGGLWIVVVFFTFIPIPMPFTGPAVVAFFVAVPLVSLFFSFVQMRAAEDYELAARLLVDEELKGS